ncbi:MAG: FIST N-terminal domain-containing protein [Verrucomicrobiota bacterium]
MLEFFSASTRMVNTRRGVTECMESALGQDVANCDLILMHAALGHNFSELMDQARKLAPRARVVAASCCGVVGREGVSESIKDIALMAVRGKRLAVAHVDGIFGHNSYEKSVELATRLREQNPTVNMIYFLASGIDIANDRCIAGIESVFGPAVTVFGATSSDNMRGIVSYQGVDENVYEHAAFAVGFADPTLEVVTQATHGFVAVGDPLVVTRSEGHRIIELNGCPAWPEYTRRLGMQATATCGDTIPVGALAELLPAELAAEYGSKHLLRVVTRHEGDTMLYATTCPVGTPLWLTTRDEAKIFSDLDRMVEMMSAKAGGRKPVAMFHADCLARGRFLFNRVLKEELVNRMQYPFAAGSDCPPWLGMYGFGEFARLGGANTYHNYTTALYALYRR